MHLIQRRPKRSKQEQNAVISSNSNQPSKAREQIVRCQESGLRITELLKLTVELLVRASRPLSIKEIAEIEGIASNFDIASVYRLIRRVEQNRIVRRIGLPGRGTYYALRTLEKCKDYLICTACGVVETIRVDCPVRRMETNVASSSGYRNLEHELKFFGVCPNCQPRETSPPSNDFR